MNSPKTGTLLEWVLGRFPDTPKTRAKQWILAGRVRVRGAVIRKPHEVIEDPGDSLELGGRGATTLDCGAGWRIHPRVTLLYFDSALAVVNKGAGLISIPDANGNISALSILADFLAGKLKPRDREVAGKSLPPAYRRLQLSPVHRLDQYTTGLFCLATNPLARQRLIGQLRAHQIKREYVAFVAGRLPKTSGTWRTWMQLDRDGFRQQILLEKGGSERETQASEAVTHYNVIAEFPIVDGRVVSKLSLQLETGLKHQIRVQAATAGVPLIGDRTYNSDYRGGKVSKTGRDFPRQALHAAMLELEHPEQPGKRLTWRADLPSDLSELESALRYGRI